MAADFTAGEVFVVGQSQSNFGSMSQLQLETQLQQSQVERAATVEQIAGVTAERDLATNTLVAVSEQAKALALELATTENTLTERRTALSELEARQVARSPLDSVQSYAGVSLGSNLVGEVSLPGTSFNDFAMSPSGSYFAASDNSGRVTIVTSATGASRVITLHVGVVPDIEFSLDGKMLASVSYDKFLSVIDTSSGAVIYRNQFSAIASQVAFSADGNSIYVGTHESGLYVVDLKARTTTLIRSAGRGNFGDIKTLGDGRMVNHFINYASGHQIIGYDKGNVLFTTLLPNPADDIYNLAPVPAKGVILASSKSGHIYVLSLIDGRYIGRFQTNPSYMYSLSVSADGNHLITSANGEWGVVKHFVLGDLAKGVFPTGPSRIDTIAAGKLIAGVEFSPQGEKYVAPNMNLSGSAPAKLSVFQSGFANTTAANASVLTSAREKVAQSELARDALLQQIQGLKSRQTALETESRALATDLAHLENTLATIDQHIQHIAAELAAIQSAQASLGNEDHLSGEEDALAAALLGDIENYSAASRERVFAALDAELFADAGFRDVLPGITAADFQSEVQTELALPQLGGTAQFRVHPGQARTGVAVLDLAAAEYLVQGVTLPIIQGEKESAIVYAFRGDESVQQVTIVGTSVAKLQSDLGISSVLIVPGAVNQSMSFGSIFVDGIEGVPQVTAKPVGVFTNHIFAAQIAPAWGNAVTAPSVQFDGLLRSNNIRMPYHGQTSGQYYFGSVPSEQYAKLTVGSFNGTPARIWGVWFLDSGILRSIPDQFVNRISDQVIVLAPGAPRHIVMGMTAGTYGWTFGNTNAELTPSMNFLPTAGISKYLDDAKADSIVPAAGEYKDVKSSNLYWGSEVRATGTIENLGLGSGQFTLQAYVGTGDRNRDWASSLIAGNVGGFGKQDFSLMLRAALKPEGAAGRPVVTLVIRDNSGQELSTQSWSMPRFSSGGSKVVRVATGGGKFEYRDTTTGYHAAGSVAVERSMSTIVAAIENSPRLHGLYTAARLSSTQVATRYASVYSRNTSDSALLTSIMTIAWEHTNQTDVSVAGVEIAATPMHGAATTEWTALGNVARLYSAPTAENTLVLVIYGSNQYPEYSEQFEGKPGFDQLVNELRHDGYRVVSLSPGDNPTKREPLSVSEWWRLPYSYQLETAKELLSLAARNPNLDHVILIGYSWGGGMVFELSKWMHDSNLRLSMPAAVYVDAVQSDSRFWQAASEYRMPIDAKRVLNLYQSNPYGDETSDWAPFWATAIYPEYLATLRGSRLTQEGHGSVLVEFDFDREDNTETHLTIDERSIQFLMRFINDVASR